MKVVEETNNEIVTVKSGAQCALHPHALPRLELTPNLTHYGKYVCSDCGRFLVWIKKPDGDKRPKRESAKLKKVFDHSGICYCQMCLRQREELPPNVTFVAHHVVEVRDGGTDDPTNLWHLCTICHELIHLLRRNRHDKECRPTFLPF